MGNAGSSQPSKSRKDRKKEGCDGLVLLPIVLRDRCVRGLTVPTPPGCFVLFVQRRIQTGGMVRLHAAGAFHQIVLRFTFQLTAGASRRTVVARPRYPSVHEDRELRRGARVVQRSTADATPAQLLGGVPFRVVVVPGYRRAETLSAYRGEAAGGAGNAAFPCVWSTRHWGPVRLPEQSAILDHKAPIGRPFRGQSERGPQIPLGLFLDRVTLPDVFLDGLQGRALPLAQLPYSLAEHLAEIGPFADLERFRLQTARILVRGLSFVEDLQHVAPFHGDFQMLGDLLLVEVVVLTDRVAYPFDARPLFLAAYLTDRVQKPGRPRLRGFWLVHLVSVGRLPTRTTPAAAAYPPATYLARLQTPDGQRWERLRVVRVTAATFTSCDPLPCRGFPVWLIWGTFAGGSFTTSCTRGPSFLG
ncbi:hypothetical protein WN55_03613 [Dufourea novaeangliae]|uniref:Uncharacterized protein n=1 Tax=Dufourea novaeangliae TaxID=178035 RepID=A0A154PIX9_DUFNO|nr:hypothetical protein WN55_03613 [Dufourea novaeangliae]